LIGAAMSYWAVANTEYRREHVATQFLEDAGFETYLPLMRAKRIVRSRRIDANITVSPDCVRERIERLVSGPSLELFGRERNEVGTAGAIKLACSMGETSKLAGNHPGLLTHHHCTCDDVE
jgi:hypothetical protein